MSEILLTQFENYIQPVIASLFRPMLNVYPKEDVHLSNPFGYINISITNCHTKKFVSLFEIYKMVLQPHLISKNINLTILYHIYTRIFIFESDVGQRRH